MIEYSAITDLARKIADHYRPVQIVLFGSYANGNPTEDSDVDLLIVMPDGTDVKRSLGVRSLFRPGFPLDVLVTTPSELASARDPHSFVREVSKTGKLLFDANS